MHENDMKVSKKIVAIILTAALCLGLVPGQTFAAIRPDGDQSAVKSESSGNSFGWFVDNGSGQVYSVSTYQDLLTALSSAKAGDTIKLCADIHITSTLKINKAITFTTDGVADRTIYVDHTTGDTAYEMWGIYLADAKVTFKGSPDSRLIIDGQSKNRDRGLLFVSTKAGALVQYVTVQNGINVTSGNNGCGGMYVSNGTATFGDTVIDNCIIQNCKSTAGNGGGLTVNTKNVWVKNTIIRNNSAPAGSGGGLNQPSQSNTSGYTGCIIEQCVIYGNTAKSGADLNMGLTVGTIRKCFVGTESTANVVKGTAENITYHSDIVTSSTKILNLLDKLPAYTGGAFVTYVDGDATTEEAVYTGTKEDYDNYVTAAEAALGISFEKKNIDGLYYANGYFESTRFIIYYTDYNGTIRIVADLTSASEPGTFKHPIGDVTPSVTMINCDDEVNDTQTKYGLCLIYQLSDGSFIIVDGGYPSSYYGDTPSASTRIYNKLVELHGSSTGIVIAAWLISHSHNDHAGAYVSFASQYGSKVTLERLLWNYPNDTEYGKATYGGAIVNPNGDPDSNLDFKKQSKAVSWAKYKVKVHAGDVFQISDATIRILYTTEMIKPKIIANINETSVVANITVGNKKTSVLADASQFTEVFLMNTYTDALKADILTVAHHGYSNRNVSSALYAAIGASEVFWPVGTYPYNSYSSYKTNPSNIWITTNYSSEKIYIAKDYRDGANWQKSLLLGEEKPPVAQIGETGYQTLHAAVAAAKEGETIELLTDIQLPSVLKIEKSINITVADSVKGDVTITSNETSAFFIRVDGPKGSTITVNISGRDDNHRIIIDGQKKVVESPALLIQRATGSQLKYVTIKDVYTTYKTGGAGFYVTQGTDVLLRFCNITGCKNTGSTGGGAGYLTSTAGVVLVSCLIENNEATGLGGGIYAAQAGGTDGSDFIITKTRFIGNTSAGKGSALAIAGNCDISGCRFESNTGACDVYETNGFNYSRSIGACIFDKTLSKAICQDENSRIIDNLTATNVFSPEISTSDFSMGVYAEVGETLTLKFLAGIDPSEADSYEKIIFRAKLGDEASKDIEGKLNSDGIYEFAFEEIYADCMADKITGSVFGIGSDGAETFLGRLSKDISIADYCDILMSDNGLSQKQNLVDVLSAMLAFGAQCQVYSGHNTCNLATSGRTWLTVGNKTPASPIGPEEVSEKAKDATAEITGAGLNITNKISMYFDVKANNPGNVSVVIGENTYKLSEAASDKAIEVKSGVYRITIDKLNPGDYSKVVTAKVYDGKALQHTLRYSVYTYCADMSSDPSVADLVKSIYNYGEIAKIY